MPHTTPKSFSAKVPVYLRVYDISNGKAAIWSQLVLRRRIDGIWHTGIQVFGLEYFYGGGIDCMPSSQVESVFDMDVVETQLLGHTSRTRSEFERYLSRIYDKFTPDTYDLLRWNCNHFTDACARFLLNDRGIPDHILNLPAIVGSTFLGSIMLKVFQRLTQGWNPVCFSPDDPHHPCHEFFRKKEECLHETKNETKLRNGARRATAIGFLDYRRGSATSTSSILKPTTPANREVLTTAADTNHRDQEHVQTVRRHHRSRKNSSSQGNDTARKRVTSPFSCDYIGRGRLTRDSALQDDRTTSSAKQRAQSAIPLRFKSVGPHGRSLSRNTAARFKEVSGELPIRTGSLLVHKGSMDIKSQECSPAQPTQREEHVTSCCPPASLCTSAPLQLGLPLSSRKLSLPQEMHEARERCTMSSLKEGKAQNGMPALRPMTSRRACLLENQPYGSVLSPRTRESSAPRDTERQRFHCGLNASARQCYPTLPKDSGPPYFAKGGHSLYREKSLSRGQQRRTSTLMTSPRGSGTPGPFIAGAPHSNRMFVPENAKRHDVSPASPQGRSLHFGTTLQRSALPCNLQNDFGAMSPRNNGLQSLFTANPPMTERVPGSPRKQLKSRVNENNLVDGSRAHKYIVSHGDIHCASNKKTQRHAASPENVRIRGLSQVPAQLTAVLKQIPRNLKFMEGPMSARNYRDVRERFKLPSLKLRTGFQQHAEAASRTAITYGDYKIHKPSESISSCAQLPLTSCPECGAKSLPRDPMCLRCGLDFLSVPQIVTH